MRNDVTQEEFDALGLGTGWHFCRPPTGTQEEIDTFGPERIRIMGDEDNDYTEVTYAMLKKLSVLFETDHVAIDTARISAGFSSDIWIGEKR